MLERFAKKERRQNRIRSKVSGTESRPRLSVSVSNLHIIAQIIDDVNGKTLAYTDDITTKMVGTKTVKAAKVGENIAELALKQKVNEVVFDRGGKLYHGRVKALAEAARAKGLKF
ncbi:MAG: 50S ribosomal protein L18 [bacterium]